MKIGLQRRLRKGCQKRSKPRESGASWESKEVLLEEGSDVFESFKGDIVGSVFQTYISMEPFLQ